MFSALLSKRWGLMRGDGWFRMNARKGRCKVFRAESGGMRTPTGQFKYSDKS